MSSKGYAAPLRLEVGPNRSLRILVALFVLAGTLVLIRLPVPLPFAVTAAILYLGLARREWCRRAELGGVPVSLLWDHEQRWWWSRDGESLELLLQGESFLSPVLVALNFRSIGGGHRRHAVVLTPAALGRETFRRLLVRLRLERGSLDVASDEAAP